MLDDGSIGDVVPESSEDEDEPDPAASPDVRNQAFLVLDNDKPDLLGAVIEELRIDDVVNAGLALRCLC